MTVDEEIAARAVQSSDRWTWRKIRVTRLLAVPMCVLVFARVGTCFLLNAAKAGVTLNPWTLQGLQNLRCTHSGRRDTAKRSSMYYDGAYYERCDSPPTHETDNDRGAHRETGLV